MTRRCDKNKLL